MELLHRTIDTLRIGDPVKERNLTMFPLLSSASAAAAYLTFGQAVRSGACRLTEVSEGGSVPQLRLVNSGTAPVLLLDGEELLGAKQNRIVNLTILAPAARELAIPVSCVEHGRWRYESPEFQESPRTMYPSARAQKTAQVSHAMAHGEGERRADQGAVWDHIAAKAQRLAAHSPTGAMADIYARHEQDIDSYVREFAPREGQVGAVFAIGEQVLGLDLFDAASTLRTYLPKLVRGYALDAIDALPPDAGGIPAPGGTAIVERARHFLAGVASIQARTYPAVGLGSDLRLAGDGIAGAALTFEDRVVHLSAFHLPHSAADERGDSYRSGSRIRRRPPTH